MTKDDIHNQLKDRLANCRKLIEIARVGHFEEAAWSDEEIHLLERLLRKRSVNEVNSLLESLAGSATASGTNKSAGRATKKRKSKKPAAKKKTAKKSSRKARSR